MRRRIPRLRGNGSSPKHRWSLLAAIAVIGSGIVAMCATTSASRAASDTAAAADTARTLNAAVAAFAAFDGSGSSRRVVVAGPEDLVVAATSANGSQLAELRCDDSTLVARLWRSDLPVPLSLPDAAVLAQFGDVDPRETTAAHTCRTGMFTYIDRSGLQLAALGENLSAGQRAQVFAVHVAADPADGGEGAQDAWVSLSSGSNEDDERAS